MNQTNYPQSKLKKAGRPKKIPRPVRKHLEVVCQEVTWLNHFHEVFLQFQDIVRQSPVNSVQSEFWSFMRWAFASELIHRVDRLSEKQWKDPKKKVHSLLALMEAIRDHADLLNREHYVGVRPNTVERYIKVHPGRFDPPDTYNFHRFNEEFSKYVGKTKFSLSSGQVERDIRTLRKVTQKISKYRNKQLAHIAADRNRAKKAPTFKDLALAIKVIRKMTFKYFLLVNRGSHGLDFGHTDITKIFMQPWIAGQTERDVLRKLFEARKHQD